jgi:hypothetical protein
MQGDIRKKKGNSTPKHHDHYIKRSFGLIPIDDEIIFPSILHNFFPISILF